MGHTRLGRLPRTRKWQDVVGLIGAGADTADIAAATLDASKIGLERRGARPRPSSLVLDLDSVAALCPKS